MPRRITDDKYPSIPEILIMAGYEIVRLKKIIAEKDGIKTDLDKQIEHVDTKYPENKN
jgi:hypothetical protein